MAMNFPTGVSQLFAWACNSIKWYKCVLPSSRVPVDSCVAAGGFTSLETWNPVRQVGHVSSVNPYSTAVVDRRFSSQDKLSLNLHLSDVMDYSSLEPDLHQLNECFPLCFHISLPTVQRSEYLVHTLSGGCFFFFMVVFIYMDYWL